MLLMRKNTPRLLGVTAEKETRDGDGREDMGAYSERRKRRTQCGPASRVACRVCHDGVGI